MSRVVLDTFVVVGFTPRPAAGGQPVPTVGQNVGPRSGGQIAE
jgi:hypothetical protein